MPTFNSKFSNSCDVILFFVKTGEIFRVPYVEENVYVPAGEVSVWKCFYVLKTFFQLLNAISTGYIYIYIYEYEVLFKSSQTMRKMKGTIYINSYEISFLSLLEVFLLSVHYCFCDNKGLASMHLHTYTSSSAA